METPPEEPYTRVVTQRTHPGGYREARQLGKADRQVGNFGQGHAGQAVRYRPVKKQQGRGDSTLTEWAPSPPTGQRHMAIADTANNATPSGTPYAQPGESISVGGVILTPKTRD